MNTFKVRVTREYTQKCVDFIDVELRASGTPSAFAIEQNAEALVKAQMACGHRVDWIPKSVELVPYSEMFESEQIEPQKPRFHSRAPEKPSDPTPSLPDEGDLPAEPQPVE